MSSHTRNRAMRGGRSGAGVRVGGSSILALGVAAMLSGAGVTPAVANDGTSWMRFSSADSGGDPERGQRSFAREWEQSPPRGYATLNAANVNALKQAITHYNTIVAQGGWPVVPQVELYVGHTHQAVAVLRRRLEMSGDLKAGGYPEAFDYAVERAVKRFQASNGLTPTGVLDKRTIAALNVPAAARLRQLKMNLSRLQEAVNGIAKRYVVVNIPAAQIEAVENDQVISRHSAVVGKIDRPTPLLRSAIHELNFNAVWTLPPTVINKDLIPKAIEMSRRGQNVLSKYHIEAFSDGKRIDASRINWSSPAAKNFTFRQQPGPENPLGFVKINFHNNHSVYMHDTPSQSLFGRNFRAASSGCVRVQGIESLATWLLQGNGDWGQERVNEMKRSGERADVKLRRPVPLYFVYITAWATEDGVVHFRRDLYQKDGVGPMASAY